VDFASPDRWKGAYWAEVRTILETARLRLREISRADLDFVAAMLGDPEVMRHYEKPLSREEAESWIARQTARYARDGHGLWLVEERSTGAPVGTIGLVMQSVDGVAEAEVAYLVHRPYWQRGFAIEAALAVRDHAFGALGKARVISLIRPANLASQAVARRLGMALISTTLREGLEHLVFAVDRPPADSPVL
jgi:RimJ/RimL family protein N-acetyltransferase